jgi:acetylornithine deacetylase/succinyl-diaminopimelate desuccinylase-like protein
VPSSEQLAALGEFLAIPSVSLEGGPPMRAAAEWVAARLPAGRVVDNVALGELPGPPGAPTILVYGHYDVQPAGDPSEWTTPPFRAAVRDGRIYARGATDDKGPVFVALETARAFGDGVGGPPLSVKFLIEGEEEIGSPSLPGFLRAHADELRAGLVVSADGAMWRPSEPSVPIAAKGLLALDIEVSGPASDLHSGRHGGAVHNPNHALALILASLHRAGGDVAVPGFYDGVREVDVGDIPFDEAEYQRDVGVPELFGEPGYTTLERLWTRPTLEVNGLHGGGDFTVIPRRASAHVTCRLVGGQDPDAVFAAIERHVTAPPGVTVSVTRQPGAVPAYELATDHVAVRAAVAALRHAYPRVEPLLVRIGGTLPAAVMFERELGLKTLLFSFSTADENLHAPDEFIRLERIDAGIVAWSELWRRLSDMMPA